MSRRLDIGVTSYGKQRQLQETVAAIQKHSVTDWRLFLLVNPHPTVDMRECVSAIADRDSRIIPVWLESNLGYAGAINAFMAASVTEYRAYVDDDATIQTPGWDETLCGYLDRFHEVGLIFPNGGAYPIPRGAYTEVQWAAGFCFVVNGLCAAEVSKDGLVNGCELLSAFMDAKIGHQNECDLALRVRMAGWKCAAAPEVSVRHEATATNNPAASERIAAGVRDFVNKWCRYFCGKNVNYHSPNVLRWEDWPPNALYMEEWWKSQSATSSLPIPPLSKLNESPIVISCQGREYDLIRVPRFSGFYRSRII